MTQRRLPSVGMATPQSVKGVPSAVISTNEQFSGDENCSLQVAFEELQCHLKQSRDEIARLGRLRAKLTAEVDAKGVSLSYLQQELDKRDREMQQLKSKVDETNQENAELRKRLEGSVDSTKHYPTYPWSEGSSQREFWYPVELGCASSGQDNPPNCTVDEMSKHLMSQMHKEMRELRDLGRKMAREGVATPQELQTPRENEDQSEEEVLGLVASLAAQLAAAKDRLLGQREALLSLLSNCGD